jgi:hypothetical protein
MWTREWPRSPGAYWLWDGSRIRFIHTSLNAAGRPMWYGTGRFYYPEEVPEARFMPAEVPDPPVD